MTMLEDELREMFHARVRTPPAALDPARAAIKRGRGTATRRRTVAGSAIITVFAVVLVGVASIKGIWGTPEAETPGVTYDAIYGPARDQPDRGGVPAGLPAMNMPVDVHVGTALWTKEGGRLTLPGVEDVIEVVRVPAGWLYSDDFRLRLLTVGGKLVPVAEDVSNWTVSPDGEQLATVRQDATLAVGTPSGETSATTPVPGGIRAVGFDGGRVVLSRNRAGSDLWSGGRTAYQETWDEALLVVYGGRGEDAIGLYQQGPSTCLVDLKPGSDGWHVGAKLGCGELLATAARAGYGLSRAARSPDGRWLAVPSPTGVHLIDVHASRLAAVPGVVQDGPPVVVHTCISTPDAPAVWADAETMLTIASGDSVVACGVDGQRRAVLLPEGVTDGWALVRRFGVPD